MQQVLIMFPFRKGVKDGHGWGPCLIEYTRSGCYGKTMRLDGVGVTRMCPARAALPIICSGGVAAATLASRRASAMHTVAPAIGSLARATCVSQNTSRMRLCLCEAAKPRNLNGELAKMLAEVSWKFWCVGGHLQFNYRSYSLPDLPVSYRVSHKGLPGFISSLVELRHAPCFSQASSRVQGGILSWPLEKALIAWRRISRKRSGENVVSGTAFSPG